MRKRVISTLLAMCIVLTILPGTALAYHDENNVAYPVTGGNIYFDATTGTITDCDFIGVTEAIIPNTISGVPVTNIGDGAFYECLRLTRVTIPDSVTSIGAIAFYGCKNLVSVAIPNSVISIGHSAFEGCNKLNEVTIPNGVTSIEDSTFFGCGITNISIPNSVTSIGDKAFYACRSLTDVTIPNSVTSIGRNAFSSCNSLTSVIIPDGVTNIREYTFWHCDSLTSVTIPDSIINIGDVAFWYCDSLADVYYQGSKAQWEQISIGDYNDTLIGATIHYNNTGGVPDIPPAPDGIQDTVQTNDYKVISLHDSSNTETPFSYAVPTSGVTMLVFFRAENCSNSVYTLKSIAQSSWIKKSDLRIVLVETTGASKEAVQSFVDENLGTNQIYFFDILYRPHSPNSPPSNSPYYLQFQYSKLVYSSNSVEWPFVMLITNHQGRNYIQFSSMGMHDASYYGNALSTLLDGVDYADTVDVKVAGTQNFDAAAEIVQKVNAQRNQNGQKNLSWNNTLTEYAMQRAAEIALYYDHIRPNGESYNSIFDSQYGTYNWVGENIAWGQTGAIAVMNYWMSSDGHKANILSPNYTQIGVGSFTSNNTTYWVQLFGDSTTNTTQTNSYGVKPANVTVSTLTTHLNTQLTTTEKSITLSDGKTASLYLVNTNSQTGKITTLVPVVSDIKDKNNSGLTIATVSIGADDRGTVTLHPQATGTGTAYFKAYEGDPNPATILLNTEVSGVNDDNVFLKQATGSKTCTLVTATMMVRRRALLDGISDWMSITESKMRDVAWGPNGFIETFSYRGITGGTYSIRDLSLERRKEELIHMLQQHPEGIGVYSYMSSKQRHAVLLTDYDATTDTFYCADPAGSSKGRVPLSQCTITWGGKGQNGVLSVLHRVYYVAKDNNRKTLVSSQISSHCPVEMILSINGELLDSRNINGTQTSSYATMTVVGTGENQTVEVQISGNYVDYFDTSVELIGTGTGKMTFTIEHLFSDGSVEQNTFEGVPVTDNFSAEASGFYPQSSVLLFVSDTLGTDKQDVWVSNPDEIVTQPYTNFDNLEYDDTLTTVFTDVPADAYYANAVAWAVENGVTQGTSATTFSPNANCTRSQIVTFLWRANGEPEPTTTKNPFADVKPSDFYYKAVLWAVEEGITQGTSATTFSPNEPCTRSQAVTFLWRSEDQPIVSGSTKFTDVPAGEWYSDAVSWAVAKDVTQGTSATTFEPNAICSRAQIVTFLYRDMAG